MEDKECSKLRLTSVENDFASGVLIYFSYLFILFPPIVMGRDIRESSEYHNRVFNFEKINEREKRLGKKKKKNVPSDVGKCHEFSSILEAGERRRELIFPSRKILTLREERVIIFRARLYARFCFFLLVLAGGRDTSDVDEIFLPGTNYSFMVNRGTIRVEGREKGGS